MSYQCRHGPNFVCNFLPIWNNERIPEWRTGYIDLKMLLAAVENSKLERRLLAHSPDHAGSIIVDDEESLPLLRPEDSVNTKMEAEITRASAFVATQFDVLDSLWRENVQPALACWNNPTLRRHVTSDTATRQATRTVYEGITLLSNFALLNRLAINHFCTEHTHRPCKHGDHALPSFHLTSLRAFRADIENTFATAFFGGNVRAASAELRSSIAPPAPSKRDMLFVGVCLGMTIMAAVVIVSYGHTITRTADPLLSNWTLGLMPVYRALALVAILALAFSAVYATAKIRQLNINVLFDVHESIPSPFRIMGLGFFLLAVLSSMVTLTSLNVTLAAGIPMWLPPVVAWAATMAFFLVPYPNPKAKLRGWRLMATMVNPLSSVTFATNFWADFGTSLVKLFVDMYHGTCLVMSRSIFNAAVRTHGSLLLRPVMMSPVAPSTFHSQASDFESCDNSTRILAPYITIFPFAIRFAQCLRRFYDDKSAVHLANAFKYLLSISTIVALSFSPQTLSSGAPWNSLRVCLILLFIINTAYTFCWDTFFDWSFVRLVDAKDVDLGDDSGSSLHGSSNSQSGDVSPLALSDNDADAAEHHIISFRGKSLIWRRTSFPIVNSSRLYPLFLLINLVGRLWWTYTLVTRPPGSPWLVQLLILIAGIVEIVRRCFWALFRMDNEQHYNASKYRVLCSIPVLFRKTEEAFKDLAAAPGLKLISATGSDAEAISQYMLANARGSRASQHWGTLREALGLRATRSGMLKLVPPPPSESR